MSQKSMPFGLDQGQQDCVVEMVCQLLPSRGMVGDIQPDLDDVCTKGAPAAHSPLERCFGVLRLTHDRVWGALRVEGDHGPSWVV